MQGQKSLSQLSQLRQTHRAVFTVWTGLDYFRLGYNWEKQYCTGTTPFMGRIKTNRMEHIQAFTRLYRSGQNCTGGFKAIIWHRYFYMARDLKKAITNVGTGLGNFRADFRMTLKDTRVEQEGKLVVWLMDATDGIIHYRNG